MRRYSSSTSAETEEDFFFWEVGWGRGD